VIYNERMTNFLRINELTGLLVPVNYQSSPHHDARPAGVQIDMIVVHGISLPPGEFGSAAVSQFFCGQLPMDSHPAYLAIANLRVSAHLFIRRTGEIIQFVPFHARAWHAGVSYFQGKSHCNDFSIGIELEGTDDLPYEDCQYIQLSQVVSLLLLAYPGITQDRIVGHEDIAPGRKTDPGPFFNWPHFRGLIA
jgi:N-acetyl-anhydromuramoyl-L-alanine amidase